MGLDDVLAQAPVHWTDPRVRSLHEAVVIQLPFPDDIKRVAAAAGIAAGDLPGLRPVGRSGSQPSTSQHSTFGSRSS